MLMYHTHMLITHCKCCCDSGPLLLVLCSFFCHCSSSVNHTDITVHKLEPCLRNWWLWVSVRPGPPFFFSSHLFWALPWSSSSLLGLPLARSLWYGNMAVCPSWTLRCLCTVLYHAPWPRCTVQRHASWFPGTASLFEDCYSLSLPGDAWASFPQKG